MVARYNHLGLKLETALVLAEITRHQYQYQPLGKKRGKRPSETTLVVKENKVECVPNEVVVEEIKSIKKDPDTDYGYIKMTYYLLILGYLINHKKVYRLIIKIDS